MGKLVENDIMYLKNLMLLSLPDNFKTPHSLDCTDSNIVSLPNGLEVGGDLILGNANITELPKALTVGKNIIFSIKDLHVPSEASIGGKIIYSDGREEKRVPSNHVITEDGNLVVYKKTKIFMNEHYFPNDYYFPQLTYYKNICSDGINAVSFSENNQTYILSCQNVKDAYSKVEWKRAKNAGIDNLKDLDIYELRTVLELKEIYQICTGACESGIKRFIDEFNIDMDKKYSINDLRNMVLEVSFYAGGKEVFLDFFNPNKQKEAE